MNQTTITATSEMNWKKEYKEAEISYSCHIKVKELFNIILIKNPQNTERLFKLQKKK